MHSSKLFLEASALLLCWALVQATPAALQALDDSAEAQERLLFGVVPQLCTGPSGKGGVCRSSRVCASRGQVGDGRCGWLNFGVCCVDRTSGTSITSSPSSEPCRMQISDPGSMITNPNYPSAETEALGSCVATFTTDSNICQLRLDFYEFTLADPDNEGVCLDYLQVSGSTIPKICGENKGHHLFVDVSSESDVDITVVAKSVGEKWRIRVNQIACNSSDEAPSGCLQYHRSISGTITSFNYNPSSTPGTRQIADLSYEQCIIQQPGYCSVTYTQAPGSSFSLSGDPTALAPGVTGAPLVGSVDCTADYLLIPGSTIDDNSNFADPKPTSTDRFCGLSFPGATTSLTPYKINFISDSDELSGGDSNNEGFQLSYELNPCTG